MKATKETKGTAALVAFFPLFAFVASFTFVAQSSGEGVLEKARQLHRYGRTELAVKRLRDMLKSEPDNTGAQGLLGIILSDMGSNYAGEAIEWLNKAIEDRPKEPDYHVGLCRALRNLGGKRLEDAATECRKALELDTRYYPVYRERGLLYQASGDLKKAVRTWERGAQVAPGNYFAHYQLGLGYLEISSCVKALESLKKALSLAEKSIAGVPPSDYSGIKLALGDALLKNSMPEESLEMYRQAARQDLDGKWKKRALGGIKSASSLLKKRRKRTNSLRDRKALEPEPDNSIAGQGLGDAGRLSVDPAEMLAEMKERKAVDSMRTALSEEEISMFHSMRKAEKMGAVDFLKSRVRSLSGYVIEKKQEKGPALQVSLLLTLSGFQAYRNYLTQDAIRVFELNDVSAKYVFGLRDQSGKPLFDSSGKLTPEGETVYLETLDGYRRWLLPGEPAPSGEDSDQARKIKEFIEEGYMEISGPEYFWLARATDCPEDVMCKELDFIVITSTAAESNRYFVYTKNDRPGWILASYVERYRSGDTSIPGLQGTAFFGTGGVRGRRLCHDGRLWRGE